MRTIEPADADDLARALADASAARQTVLVRGGGTKLQWSSNLQVASCNLDMRSLNRVLAHRHGDLTATVEAGATLADVNRELAQHGQWIPLDPPWADRATIGGIVSTNDVGPRRHRFGAPRDLIIGVEFARADGVRAKAGGIVVKNVAGYDLARLLTGSFGCLAVILNATFKLYPLPAVSRTLVANLPSTAAAGTLVAAFVGSQLTPTAIEIQSPPLRLLVRFESTADSADAQCAKSVELVEASGGRASIVRDEAETAEWQRHGERPWQSGGAVVKVTTMPASLTEMLNAIARSAEQTDYEIAGRAGLGVLLVRLGGDAATQARAITALRDRCAPGRGSVVVLRGTDDLLSRIDRWGPMGDAFPVMQAVKRTFDPLGILNPGRGPGGL